MRTTIRLDDHLLREAKKYAAEAGRSLTGVIEDALREVLARRKAAVKRERVRLPTFRGQGLQPGVNLNSNAELLDLMEKDKWSSLT